MDFNITAAVVFVTIVFVGCLVFLGAVFLGARRSEHRNAVPNPEEVDRG